MGIGARIRERRKELGLTQTQLGKKAGLGTSTISGLEIGGQQSTTKLHAIAQALGVHTAWLAQGKLPKLLSEKFNQADSSVIAAHGIQVSLEGAMLGAEWDKIDGENFRKLARELIEALVAAQRRGDRPARGRGNGKRKGRDGDGPQPRE